MSARFRILVLVLGIVPPLGCSPGEPPSSPEAASASGSPAERGAIVGIVDGAEIRSAELRDHIQTQLYEQATRGKSGQEVYELRREALEQLVMRRVVEAEAAKQGISADDLYDRVVGTIEVGDAEVATFFEQNRDRLPEGTTLDEVAAQIQQMLTNQTRVQTWSAYVRRLATEHDIHYRLDPPRTEVAAVGPTRGPDAAPVTIVEFSDFNCPYCQRVNPTLEQLLERYPERVRLVFRHLPLPSHPRARPTAEAAVCADEQGAFWAFHDGAFAAEGPLPDAGIERQAEAAGLDMDAFRACLAEGRGREVVDRDLAAAREAGVNSTPTFFINGLELSGAQPLEAFVEVVEGELAAAGGTATPSS